MGKGKRKQQQNHSDAGSSSDEGEGYLVKHSKPSVSQIKQVVVSQNVPPPSPRLNASWTFSKATNEYILFGGEHYDGKKCTFYNDTFVFSPAKNQWTLVQSPLMPGPRSAHQALFGPDGRFYLFGGEFGTSKETRFFHYKDLWTLDLSTWEWKAINTSKSSPSGRSGHRMAIWKEYLVLFGGFFDTGSNINYLDDLWLFNTNSQKWSKLELNPLIAFNKPSPRSAFQFISFHEENDTIILYSGYQQVKGKSGIPQGKVLNDLWLLKLNTDFNLIRWDKKKLGPTAPLPRSGAASLKIGKEEFVLFGGVIDNDVSDETIQGICTNELYIYNLRINTWTRLESNILSELCPRFNTMIGGTLSLQQSTADPVSSPQSILLFGGCWEVGDKMYTLDDMHLIDLKNLANWQSLQPSLSELSHPWQSMVPEPESDTEDASSQGDESSDTESEEDQSNDGEDDQSSDGEEDQSNDGEEDQSNDSEAESKGDSNHKYSQRKHNDHRLNKSIENILKF